MEGLVGCKDRPAGTTGERSFHESLPAIGVERGPGPVDADGVVVGGGEAPVGAEAGEEAAGGVGGVGGELGPEDEGVDGGVGLDVPGDEGGVGEAADGTNAVGGGEAELEGADEVAGEKAEVVEADEVGDGARAGGPKPGRTWA